MINGVALLATPFFFCVINFVFTFFFYIFAL